MTPQNSKARRQVAATAAVFALISAALPMGRSLAAQADNHGAIRFTEQLVNVQSKDDIEDAGALFAPVDPTMAAVQYQKIMREE